MACDALLRARNAIARAALGPEASFDQALGSITLRTSQRLAAARLTSLIDAHGGAMLAEPVGLGKTYVALAVAQRWQSRLVIAPASLREMWREALAATNVDAQIVTHESLSRGHIPAFGANVIVIDEAHRLRSPATRRYAAVASLCSRTPVLLLTATPIHNRRDDLAAQLALFLGRSAWRMSSTELAAFIVRDSPTHHVHGLPALDGPHRVSFTVDDDCLDELLALPPPVPASDDGMAVALLTYSLAHQWASSQAALLAALKRRLARTLALRSAAETGRHPTRRELAAWSFADDAMQLAFPELVAAVAPDRDVPLVDLMQTLDRHADALRSLIDRMRGRPDVDAERAAALRQIRAAHPGERVIAFCQYAETVDALFRALRRESGVAALTSHVARVAGGRLPRRELLAQFTPSACPRPQRTAERIELLLTTDLLSEGLNLQEASVVIHLDLPWNPARLDQRVGRVRRLGSRHASTSVYTFSPPAASERLLRVEARLREKLSVAQRTVGVAGRILPSPFGVSRDDTAPGLAEEIGDVLAFLRRWLSPHAATSCAPIVAGVIAERDGFVAAIDEDGTSTLLADFGDAIDTSVSSVRSALESADGTAIPLDAGRASEVLTRVERWLADRRGAASIDLRAALTARSRRAALNRVAAVLARAPRHRRVTLASLAATVRAVVTAPLPEGAERVLDTLVRAELPDEAWLRSVAAFGELNVKQIPAGRAGARVVAVIVFGPYPVGSE